MSGLPQQAWRYATVVFEPWHSTPSSHDIHPCRSSAAVKINHQRSNTVFTMCKKHPFLNGAQPCLIDGSGGMDSLDKLDSSVGLDSLYGLDSLDSLNGVDSMDGLNSLDGLSGL